MKIVFTRSKKFFPIISWLIQLYQGTNYSHVALEDDDYYYQANEGKVNKEYKTYFLKENHVVAAYEIKKINTVPLEQTLGLNYGTAQNAGIILVDLFRKQIANPFSKGVNCSEFILKYVLKQLNIGNDKDPNTIKPKHIEQLLKDNGYTSG